MTDTWTDIESAFEFLDDWEQRYKYVIELGRDLSPYPEDKRDETHKVPGCVSQVWLNTHISNDGDPVLTFDGDSDAHIVRGLVAIVLALYNGKSAQQILEIDAEAALARLGLVENLTPQRSNGLRSMVKRIRAEAQQVLSN